MEKPGTRLGSSLLKNIYLSHDFEPNLDMLEILTSILICVFFSTDNQLPI